ncbi:methyl-accepting chemotaxis protein [Bacillus sp. 31A1R]|uniref:Methyl-accepting chemotaxis protein n=1 Tax=Robertmurraya mangrovi TaxID=3098077 RepID=A0ABU5J3X6_9BACI|nr:methyl-accepting chemotaxis protein [Bacillus sp. 31A1R]MDZ5474102.1 methyl-accepting chemotaxis protein [Bacillus sp. 31A1R]
MLSNLTVRRRLVLTAILTLLIPSLLIGTFSYVAAKKELQEVVVKDAKENTVLINDLINSIIGSKLVEIQLMSSMITGSITEGNDEISKDLGSFVSSNKNIPLAYYANSQGEIITSPHVDLPADFDPRQRDWYMKAVENTGKPFVSSPYTDVATGDMVLTVSLTLPNNAGVVGYDINLNELRDAVASKTIGKKGYPFIMDTTKLMIIHPTIEAGQEGDSSLAEPLFKNKEGYFSYEIDGNSKEMAFTTNELTGWKIAGTLDTNEFAETARPILINMLTVIVVCIILGITLTIFNIRRIVNPLEKMVEVSSKVAQGDLTETIDLKATNEIGKLSHSFDSMILSLRDLIGKIDSSSEQIASSSVQLSANVEESTNITRSMATSISGMASGAETQMASAEESTAAMVEIADGVQHIANQSSIASEASIDANSNAEEGKQSIDEAIKQMELIQSVVEQSSNAITKLGASSEEVGNILAVITAISEQTNLLALNAAIEAARAGEHGKGFAVVADEVRKLAEESRKSAQQIADIVQSIQVETKTAVELMDKGRVQVETGNQVMRETGEKFTSILNSIQEVTAKIQEVSATSEELSASSEEVTASVQEMTSISTESASTASQVASGAQQQLSSMEEINSSVSELADVANELKQAVSTFKISK